jgi:hypothetical protein
MKWIATSGRSGWMDGNIAKEGGTTFMGHSIGHWEGDTLVVDTVGTQRPWLDGGATYQRLLARWSATGGWITTRSIAATSRISSVHEAVDTSTYHRLSGTLPDMRCWPGSEQLRNQKTFSTTI